MLDDTIHVVRILCGLLQDLLGLGCEECGIEFVDGDLIEMALHASVLLLTILFLPDGLGSLVGRLRRRADAKS